MKKNYKLNCFISYIVILLCIFTGMTFLQVSSNALPFFYKDYPTYENNGKKDFDSNSESLVLNRIDFSTLGLQYNYKFNLWRANNEVRGFNDFRTDKETYNKNYKSTPDYLLDGKPYTSQIGIQALFFSQIAAIVSANHGSYSSLKTMSVLLLSIFCAAIILWIKVNFGVIPSIISMAGMIASTGINIFSESLYWSIWLLIAPLAIIALLDVLNIKNKTIIFLFTLPLFTLKFTTGYEFITIVVLASIVPYVWDYMINQNYSALMRAVTVGISSITAFVISIFVFHTYYMQDFNSSGFDYIFGRAGSWTLTNLGEIGVNPWLQSAKILILNFMDINGYGIPLGGFLLLIIIIMLIMRGRVHINDLKFIVFLFLGSLSWILIQPGHILFHPRYATLIFYFPFGLFVLGFITSLIFRRNTLVETKE